MLAKFFQYVFQILFYLFILESDYVDSHFIDDEGSRLIIIFLVIMHLAINFDNQFGSMRIEISNEERIPSTAIKEDGELSVELSVEKSSVAHRLPEDFLSAGVAFAQITAEFLGVQDKLTFSC